MSSIGAAAQPATRQASRPAFLARSAEPEHTPDSNEALVRASFDRWRSGTGSPFELLAPESKWTIAGSSPLSKTYPNRQAFLDEVIGPFNARLATPLVPMVRRIYADGDMVIIVFNAAAMTKDGQHYHNTYTWYFQMEEGRAKSVISFFDTRKFDELWMRVSPIDVQPRAENMILLP
jgi:uncharacterized protein